MTKSIAPSAIVVGVDEACYLAALVLSSLGIEPVLIERGGARAARKWSRSPVLTRGDSASLLRIVANPSGHEWYATTESRTGEILVQIRPTSREPRSDRHSQLSPARFETRNQTWLESYIEVDECVEVELSDRNVENHDAVVVVSNAVSEVLLDECRPRCATPSLLLHLRSIAGRKLSELVDATLLV